MNIQMPASVPSLQIGGRLFIDLKNLIILVGSVNKATQVNCTLRKMDASAGYQVPASNQLRLLAMRSTCRDTAASNAQHGRLLYADTDVGFTTSTGFTNPIYPGGSAAGGDFGNFNVLADGLFFECDWNFVVPAAKYPAILSGGAGLVNVVLYGYLEAV